MALTLIHDRKKRIAAQQRRFDEVKRAREADELAGHLRAAAKMCQKGKRPVDTLGLSTDQEIELLKEYATRLELEARDFLEAWPDKDGKHAVRWLRFERARALNQIAKLMISSAKGDD